MLKKDFSNYEVAQREGSWAIQEKGSKLIWGKYLTKELAEKALKIYQEQ